MFTAKQLKDYKAYEKVRAGGKWNMFASQAQQATGLTKDEYMFVMKNFSELRAAVVDKSAK
jgi:hypothetical protein